MNIAESSLEELRYYFILARDLDYMPEGEQWKDVDELTLMLGAYARTLRT